MKAELVKNTSYEYAIEIPGEPEEIRIIVPAENTNDAKRLYKRFLLYIFEQARDALLNNHKEEIKESLEVISQKGSIKKEKKSQNKTKSHRIKPQVAKLKTKILKILKTERKLKIIAQRLNIKEMTLWYHLNKMRKEGLVSRHGKSSDSIWIINKKRTKKMLNGNINTMVDIEADNEYMKNLQEDQKQSKDMIYCPYCLEKKIRVDEESCKDCASGLEQINNKGEI